MSEELLPRVHHEQLADAVDAFVEEGYFSPQDCEGFMEKARGLGLAIRVHADEFSNSKAAAAAARWGAKSADHLQCADEAGLRAMAEAGVVATILPGTSLYTGLPFVDARKLFAAGCAVAIASDFNPGSCFIANLPLIASCAAVQCKITPWQLIAALTLVPAFSLGLSRNKGALAAGYDGDFFVHPAAHLEGWCADMGQTPATWVWNKGALVLS
jgi:imidazolonepropionase